MVPASVLWAFSSYVAFMLILFAWGVHVMCVTCNAKKGCYFVIGNAHS